MKRISTLFFLGFIVIFPVYSETKEKFKPLPPPDFEQLMAPGPELVGTPGLPIENEAWVLFVVGILLLVFVLRNNSLVSVLSTKHNIK